MTDNSKPPLTNKGPTTLGTKPAFPIGSKPAPDTHAPQLPPWVPPLQKPQPGREVINSTVTPQSQRYATVGAEGTIIPLVFGEDFLGPIITLVHVRGGKLLLRCVWCMGEIDEITDITVNGGPMPQFATVTHYVGNTVQGVDPTLLTAIPGYNDRLVLNMDGTEIGVAYSVFSFPAGTLEGFPRIIAKIQGIKVRDPRYGWVRSTSNPSLILANLIESKVYGLGGTVDDASLSAAANHNDESVSGSPRHTFNQALTQRTSIQSWIETVRAYARCFISTKTSKYYLIPDKAGSTALQVTHADMVANSLKLEKRSLLNVPNVVKVFYTSLTTNPPSEDFVEVIKDPVLLGEEFRRESVVQMPGINNRAQAMRCAIERINEASLIDLSGSFESFDKLWALEVGDIIGLSHPVGLDEKTVRIIGINPSSRGKLRIDFVEFDANVYSDEVVDENPPPDAGGESPFDVPDITGLVLTESFYQGGGITGSQLNITFDALSYGYLQYYVIEIYEGDTKVASIRTPDNFYSFRGLVVDTVYSVKVYALSVAFAAGGFMTSNLTAQGYLIPPDFSAGQIVAFEAGDALVGNIRRPAIDIDLWGYEWRYAKFSNLDLFNKARAPWVAGNWTYTNSSNPAGSQLWTFGSTMKIDISVVPVVPRSRSATASATWVSTAGKKYRAYVKVKDIGMTGQAGDPTGINVTMFIRSNAANPLQIFRSTMNISTLGVETGSLKKGIFVADFISDGAGAIVVGLSMANVYTVTATAWLEIDYIIISEHEENGGIDEPTWDSATFVERSPNTFVRIDDLTSGEYVLFARALDNNRSIANPYGQYSENICFDWCSIKNDSENFARIKYPVVWDTTTNYGTVPSKTVNECVYEDIDENIVESSWLVPTTNSTWNTLVAGTVNSLANPVFYYFENNSGAKVLTTEVIDLEIDTTGVISFVIEHRHTLKVVEATKYSLWTQLDGGSWVETTISDVREITAFEGRYVYFEIQGPANFKEIYNFNSQCYFEINRNARLESGTLISLGPDGSGDPQPVLVTLDQRYNKAVEARAWVEASEPIKAYIDNITFGDKTTFTVVALNLRGEPVVANVKWSWRGV